MASFDDQCHWPEGDILKLLDSIKDNISSDDFRAFKKTQEDINWDKVAFENFSGKMCKQKWMEISQNLRKFRTLTELVLEAKELFKKPCKRTVKQHPDFPKRPLTAYLRFYKEQHAKYCQMYPEYSNQQLTKVLAEKYHQLPMEVKQRYIQDFQKEKQDFQKKITQFRETHPGVRHPKKSVEPRSHQIKVPKKPQGDMKSVKSPLKMKLPKTVSSHTMFQGEPKKPPMNGYQKFHQDSWSSPALHYLSFRERYVEISRRWHRVPLDQKELYNRQAEELQKQYWVKLKHWLQNLSPEEFAAYNEAKASCGKRKSRATSAGTSLKSGQTDMHSSSAKERQVRPGKVKRLLEPGTDSSDTTTGHDGGSQAIRQKMTENDKEEDSSSSSYSSSSDEDDDYLPRRNL
ncbi:upstream-binding factor 1-like protein 1 [Meriones unguiculatus]|uniref:upstream-binding factor 1-like protein 1 n=1 Tax=Meriones unguiculatus TaxID=10047 RepID=UPI000B4E90C3|nr:upstream-binding factor 1-like protein 1 [Meriones unguiculatus]